jgi:PAS domain S-box-containing protein
MAVSGQPVIIRDTHQNPDWILVPGLEWVRSMTGAPIQVDGETIGFLMLDSATPGFFTDAHASTLSIFAEQAALAIRNARLYEASQRYGREMQSRVAERTAELEQQRAQLQAILDSMNEGVEGIIYPEDGNGTPYRFTNAALFRMVGYEPDELQSKAQLKPDDVTAADFMNMLEEIRDTVFARGLWAGDMRLKHRDGHVLDIGVTATRVSRPDGRAVGLVIVMRDDSQAKALEAQKKRFVVSAAHELRTPITNINTRLFLARRQPDRIESHLDVIEKVANQLQFLVEDLLNLSRFEHGLIVLERAQTELISFIKDTVLIQEAQAEVKDIWIIDSLPAEPIYVSIDQTRMLQVFSNLVTNAIKFTREGGAVKIGVRRGQIDTPEEGYAVIEFEDTGKGIAPEHLPHIFEPFYKADQNSKGLGLGLSIIKEIIELHGGKISVTSELEHGTCFSVWLKRVDDPAVLAS